MRALTIFSGILMLATGAFCFINPGQTFLAIAFIVGIVMVINGIIHTLAYLIGRGLNNRGDNNGWILVDALITLLLGILILCNQLVGWCSCRTFDSRNICFERQRSYNCCYSVMCSSISC